MFSAFASGAFAQDQLMPVPGTPDSSKFVKDKLPINPGGVLHVGLAFSGFQKEKADAFLVQLYNPTTPSFHKWIPTSEFGRRFGPSSADIDAIRTYLGANGFTKIKVAASGVFISAETTFANAEKAFNTKFAHYQRPAEMVAMGDPSTFFSPITPPKIPAGLASRVNGVFGLCNLAMMHPASSLKTRATALKKKRKQGSGYLPADLATAYRTNKLQSHGLNGQGVKIAVISPTQRFASDVYTFAQDLGLSGFTIYDVLVDDGAADTGAATEASLDLETIIGQAPHSTLFVMQGPGGTGVPDSEYMQGELDAFDAVGVIGNIPIISSSWDLEESFIVSAGQQSFAVAFENVCEALAAYGVSIFVASGDAAAYSNTGSGKVTTKLETSCPFVTSVGGTNLSIDGNSNWVSEKLWTYTLNGSSPEGGGGGRSVLYKLPSWQTGPGVNNAHSNGFRQVPDISADGDPATGYAIIAGGQVSTVGGTSASTPLWAANLALFEQGYASIVHQQVFLGSINPALYYLGHQFLNPTTVNVHDFYVYHDITVGNNGVYPTTVDWDFCSGWGSADFYNLYHDLGYYYQVPTLGPDYIPFNPGPTAAGWKFPVMISTSSTSVTEPASFSHTQTLHFSVCLKNAGVTDAPKTVNALIIDGHVVANPRINALPPGLTEHPLNVYSTTLTAGTHTIKFTVNYQLPYKETNTTNDTYTRTITVG